MKKVCRFDVGRMDAAEVTPWGFLRAPAYATRVGVFKYRNADGSVRRELRLPEEVFKEESLRSLAGVPVTDDHPDIPLITSENARKYMRGYTGESITPEGEFVKAHATITDADLIEKVKAGKVEVSCGYECEHEENPGVWNGQPYDVIQRNIQYNHLAVVDRGRAGPAARLRFDAADMVEDPEEEVSMEMVKIKIGEKEFEVPADVAAHIQSMVSEKEAMMGEMDGMKAAQDGWMKEKADLAAKAAAEAAEKDRAIAKADSLAADLEKAKVNHDAGSIEERVKQRVKILTVGAELLPAEKAQKMDSLSDLEIKKEIILADAPNAALEGKSEVYIAARFDSIVESHEAKGRKFTQIGKILTQNRQDSAEGSDAEKARKAALERDKNAWKQPLAASAN